MEIYLHNIYIYILAKTKLFLILLFSLLYFDGFAQNINVLIHRNGYQIYQGLSGCYCGDANYPPLDLNDIDCGIGTQGFPDIYMHSRLYINATIFQHDVGQDNIFWWDGYTNCVTGWTNRVDIRYPHIYEYYDGVWYQSPVGGIPKNSTIAFEVTGLEDDNAFCGGNDAECSGYQTLLSASTIIDRFDKCERFKDSVLCTSDGETRWWGLDASVLWEWVSLFPGTIESDKTICPGTSSVTIKSLTNGTLHSSVSKQWQYSTDNLNWTDLSGETNLSQVIVNTSSLSAGQQVYIRRSALSNALSASLCSKYYYPFPNSQPLPLPPTPPSYSNVCTIHIISPPTTAPTATPSNTGSGCGNLQLSNPTDPLNNTVPFQWESQFSINSGANWSPLQSPKFPIINSNTTVNSRNVCIRFRANYDMNCGNSPFKTYCYTQSGASILPTLDSIYPDPSNSVICGSDAGIWATFVPGKGFGGHDEFQYSINGGAFLTYTERQIIPVPASNIIIRGRRIGGFNCPTAWDTLATWLTIIKLPIVNSPTLNTKTPNVASICKSTNVSATINSGSGGILGFASDVRQFSVNGGKSWSNYTTGSIINTDNAIDSVLIRVMRNDGVGGAGQGGYCSTDWKVIAKWIITSPLAELQFFSLPICNSTPKVANLTATNPSPGVGTWSILSGAGSFSNTTVLSTILSGLKLNKPTTIRWSVIESGCTKNFDTTITPATASLANLTNGGLCQSCPVANGNSYNFYDNTGKLMAKIDDLVSPVAELSTTEVCVGIDVSVQKILTNTGVLQPYLQRHFSIKPINNTNTTVTLYFTKTEFQNLKTSAIATPYAFTNVNQLIVSKFPGGSNNTYTLPDTTGGTFITPTASGIDINNYYFITIPVATFSTFYIHPISGSPAVLPIELSYFTAVCESNKIKINWQTVSENNNHLFEIERSENAVDYTTIISVPTQNENSNQTQNYLVYDNQPKNKMLYYRLKQIDNDGNYSYSKITTVNCQYSTEKNMVVSIYPNPTKDLLNVLINTIQDANVTIKLYDLNSKLVLQKQIEIEQGNNLIDISLQDLVQGMYFVEINNNYDMIYKNKIIKQ